MGNKFMQPNTDISLTEMNAIKCDSELSYESGRPSTADSSVLEDISGIFQDNTNEVEVSEEYRNRIRPSSSCSKTIEAKGDSCSLNVELETTQNTELEMEDNITDENSPANVVDDDLEVTDDDILADVCDDLEKQSATINQSMITYIKYQTKVQRKLAKYSGELELLYMKSNELRKKISNIQKMKTDAHVKDTYDSNVSPTSFFKSDKVEHLIIRKRALEQLAAQVMDRIQAIKTPASGKIELLSDRSLTLNKRNGSELITKEDDF